MSNPDGIVPGHTRESIACVRPRAVLEQRSHYLQILQARHVLLDGGNVQGRQTIPLLGIHVRTTRQQQSRRSGVALMRGNVERRRAYVIAGVHVGTALYEQPLDFDVRFVDGKVQRCPVVIVASIDAVALQEASNMSDVIPPDSFVHGAAVTPLALPDVPRHRPQYQQQDDHAEATVLEYQGWHSAARRPGSMFDKV